LFSEFIEKMEIEKNGQIEKDCSFNVVMHRDHIDHIDKSHCRKHNGSRRYDGTGRHDGKYDGPMPGQRV
jgi:hypothetical protein